MFLFQFTYDFHFPLFSHLRLLISVSHVRCLAPFAYIRTYSFFSYLFVSITTRFLPHPLLYNLSLTCSMKGLNMYLRPL